MIFFKLTLLYLKKSFFVLALICLLPAALLGVFSSPIPVITFLPHFIQDGAKGFDGVFWLIISNEGVNKIFPYILFGIAFIICVSYCITIIEKHFKTGRLGLVNPVRAINNSLLATIKTLPIFFALIVIMIIIQSGLISLIHLAFNAELPSVLESIWVSLVSGVVYIILGMFAIICMVWAVVMHIYGYSFADAFVESMRTISKNWFGLVCGLIIPTTVLIIPTLATNILGLKNSVIPVNITLNLLIFVYYTAYIVVSVYEINGLERRDNKKRYIS